MSDCSERVSDTAWRDRTAEAQVQSCLPVGHRSTASQPPIRLRGQKSSDDQKSARKNEHFAFSLACSTKGESDARRGKRNVIQLSYWRRSHRKPGIRDALLRNHPRSVCRISVRFLRIRMKGTYLLKEHQDGVLLALQHKHESNVLVRPGTQELLGRLPDHCSGPLGLHVQHRGAERRESQAFRSCGRGERGQPACAPVDGGRNAKLRVERRACLSRSRGSRPGPC